MSFYNRSTTKIIIVEPQPMLRPRPFSGFSPVGAMFGSFMNMMSTFLMVQLMNRGNVGYNQGDMPYPYNNSVATRPYIPMSSAPSAPIGDTFVPRSSSYLYSSPGVVPASTAAASSSVATPTTVSTSTSVSSANNVTYGKKDLNFWKNLGYNPEKGQQLVNNAKKSKYRGKRHECVAVVREAINDTYYGGQTHYSRFGKACDIGDQFLNGDTHFKKIVPNWDVSPNDFPPGAIIIYRGDNGSGNGYVRGDNRGHGELAYGDGSGKGISNYDLKIKPQFIKEVWIPV
ncbi:MAG: hypothetical protein K6E29_03755 [Cyanobacteria bacterium RUI128]|nr:hypothetical protein [Cyanobacteria bacterium RUI128]